MARVEREQSDLMDEGADLQRRRERLGMTKVQLAKEAGVTRETLAAIEKGQGYRGDTLVKIHRALKRLEEEAGLFAPPSPEASEGGLVTFRLTGNFGVDVTVEGPVGNLEELEASVEKLLRGMRSQDD